MNSTRRSAGSETIPARQSADDRGTSSSATGSKSQKTTSARVGDLIQTLRHEVAEELTTTPAVVSLDSTVASKNRREWLLSIIERWESNAGVDISDKQIKGLARELDKRQYSERCARVAEDWILRGDSIKYGRITIRDFYPTLQQLETIGAQFDGIIRAERAAGHRDGYQEGRLAGIAALDDNLAYLSVITRTRRIRDYSRRITALRAREREADAALQQAREHQRRAQRFLNRMTRSLSTIMTEFCTQDHDTLRQLINHWRNHE